MAVLGRHETLAGRYGPPAYAWGRARRSGAEHSPNPRPAAATLSRRGRLKANHRPQECADWSRGTIGLTLGTRSGHGPQRQPEKPRGSSAWGHMGHVNGQMVMGMLGGIEAGMSALDIQNAGTGWP